MSSHSCPELDALVARVGLEEAMRTVRGWIGRRDAEEFLRENPSWGAAATTEEQLAPPLDEPCRCGANRGADCDCWEDYFREEDDSAGGLAAASSAAPSPAQFTRLQTQMLDALRAAENDPTEPNVAALSAAMYRFEAAGGGEGDNYKYCLARYRVLTEKHTK
jgi:hypothetical protein